MSVEVVVEGAPWLLLIHQLPAKPAYARVKTWRRLQALGAISVKNAVYALPNNDETREDFAWLGKEIVENGGEAVVCEAQFVEGLSDHELRGLFNAARDEAYGRLIEEARELTARLSDEPPNGVLGEIANQTVRLRKQFGEIAAIDFFGADGRRAAGALLASLESRLQEGSADTVTVSADQAMVPAGEKLWVTREHVQVDRIASAWLIRRFIEPNARFKFVPGRSYEPKPGEIRFDMFEGEYTHEGDRCTFEVLLGRSGLDDRALGAIGEIIHDIDLKDGKYGREETAGIRNVIAGIAAAYSEDEQRLARGAAVLDDLYQYFRTTR
jgi:hypothetical protein